MLPGYTQTDDTHPELGRGGANVGLQHLGRIPNCSEVPDTCVFFAHSRGFWMFWGAPYVARVAGEFCHGHSKNLSGARSGNPQAWLVFLGISEHGPTHFRKNIRGDLEMRSKAI